jgi:hypothetical protein
MLQPTLLGEPFRLGRISLRRLRTAPCLALRDGQDVPGGSGQAFLDDGDRGTQTRQMAVLGIAGQSVLVIVASDDRVGPPSARLGGQRRFTRVEPGPAHLPPGIGVQSCRLWLGPTCRREVRAPQPAQMLGNQIQHTLVVRAGLQPGPNRYARRRRHRLHPTPLPQPRRPHTRTIPPITDRPHDQHRPTNQPTAKHP